VLNVFRKHYLINYKNKTVPYEGALETLIELKNRNYLLAVCTNKLHEAALDIVNAFFPNIFDYILGSKKELKKKPDPEMIEFILKELNVSKKDTLYIGDTNVDYEVAYNSKVDYILVSYGYRKKDFLSKIDEKSIIIDQISDLLTKI
jgi:phosphoglycolate phosphatase